MRFPYIVLCLFTFRCYCYHHYKIPKTLLLLPLPLLSYYFATKYFAADIKFPGVVELTTQLLILENILWLALCRINKFGLNTLPSQTVAIPYTCGLSITTKSQRKKLNSSQQDREGKTPYDPTILTKPAIHQVLEICPRGNNKWLLLYFCVHDNSLLFML